MFRVSCFDIWWRHNIWISEKLKFDYLKNEKSFWSEIRNIFLYSQVLSFRYKKQTSRNVALTATRFEAKVVFLLWHSCWFMYKWTDVFADICFKLGLTGDFWNKQASRTLSRKQNQNFEHVFLSVVWLSHKQLWTTLEGTASCTWC